ncbi:MAG: type IV pilin N-terminal domain-containing protein [Candidatus Aenigmatarchaeota archaeon]
MKPMHRKEVKGVSPMIATVLLVAMTVTLAAVIVPWAINFAQTQMTTVNTQGEEKVNCIEAGLNFQSSDVGYDSLANPARINVTITNTGLVGLYDFRLQFKLGDSYSALYSPTTQYNVSGKVSPQQKVTLNASIPQLTGTLKSVRVISNYCKLAAETTL